MFWKPHPSGLDLVGGTLIGTFFTTMLLVDFSVMSYSMSEQAFAFTYDYLIWKLNAPIVKYLMLMMLPGLPFVIFKEGRCALLWTFTRKATPVRHISDVLSFFTLLTIFIVIYFHVLPLETQATAQIVTTLSTPAGDNIDPSLLSPIAHTVSALRFWYGTLIFANGLLIALPFIKYWQKTSEDEHGARKPFEA